MSERVVDSDVSLSCVTDEGAEVCGVYASLAGGHCGSADVSVCGAETWCLILASVTCAWDDVAESWMI